jgi:hypothetical protein
MASDEDAAVRALAADCIPLLWLYVAVVWACL